MRRVAPQSACQSAFRFGRAEVHRSAEGAHPWIRTKRWAGPEAVAIVDEAMESACRSSGFSVGVVWMSCSGADVTVGRMERLAGVVAIEKAEVQVLVMPRYVSPARLTGFRTGRAERAE